MPSTVFSTRSLIDNLDEAFPAAGNWGYFTLLSGDLTIGLAYAADAVTDELTAATAHGLVTGSRVRLTSGVLPTPLLGNTDYFAIVSSPTVLKVAVSLVDAELSVSIDLTDAGSGVLALTEQALTAADPLSVLVNKELNHPSWLARTLIDNLGGAVDVAGVAEKLPKTINVDNTSASPMSWQHHLFIESTALGAGALGGIPVGAGFILVTEGVIETINVGDPGRIISFTLKARNL